MAAALRLEGRRENRKRVLRLMREDNVLALRKRRFICSTDSQHGLAVYPNLAASLKLERVKQLWVADITYIRLREEFVYWAVLVDAYWRRVVGWEVNQSLDTQLTLRALERAIAARSIPSGVVHHSDRGVQYCSHAYVAQLQACGFLISMSGKGRPWDNARAESFMKTLKCEEVYLQHYRDLRHVRESMAVFIDEVYNVKRLHSALGYRSPADFEAAQVAPSALPAESRISL